MAEQDTSYALSDLVKRRRAELRLSLRKFADACIDPDTGIQEIKHAWVERLEKRQNVTPLKLPELRALRAGLQVPMRDVQDAAGAQFFGITTRDADAAGNIRVLMNRAADLSPDDLARLVAIAETLPINSDQPGESSK